MPIKLFCLATLMCLCSSVYAAPRCVKSAESIVSTKPIAPGSYYLRPGQSICWDKKRSFLTFLRVTLDSRCPANAACLPSVAEGAEIRVRLNRRGKQREYTLINPSGDRHSIKVGKQVIGFVYLDPYPGVDNGPTTAAFDVSGEMLKILQ